MNNIGWGQGAVNNAIGWGQGVANNSISWGLIANDSYSPETNLTGLSIGWNTWDDIWQTISTQWEQL